MGEENEYILEVVVSTWSVLVANMRLTGWCQIAIVILQLVVLIYAKFTSAMPKHLPRSNVLWVNEDKYDSGGHYYSDRNIQRAR